MMGQLRYCCMVFSNHIVEGLAVILDVIANNGRHPVFIQSLRRSAFGLNPLGEFFSLIVQSSLPVLQQVVKLRDTNRDSHAEVAPIFWA